MGLDIHYQAVQETCTLLARSRHDPDFGANLEFFESRVSMSQEKLDYFADEQSLVEFVHEARQTVEQYPGIEQRNLYLGRGWDKLYYLLSERRRRGEPQDGSDWAEKAIFGGSVLNAATQTTIGFRIRYLSPDEVIDVKHQLETVTVEMLHDHWNPQAMSKAGVYKIRAEDDFEWVQEDFEKLKNFYALIAEYQEGILTFVS